MGYVHSEDRVGVELDTDYADADIDEVAWKDDGLTT